MIDFSVKPTLTGERVVLRPVRDDDLPALAGILADPEVARLTGSPAGETFEPARLRAWYGTRNSQADRLDLAVVDRASGVCVGDRPDTDGRFARALGYRFVLVLSGVTTPADLPVDPEPDAVHPDLATAVDAHLDGR